MSTVLRPKLVLVALTAAVVVFFALFPTSVQDSIPSKQWGAFGNEVPSPFADLAMTASLIAFAVTLSIGVATSFIRRGRMRRRTQQTPTATSRRA